MGGFKDIPFIRNMPDRVKKTVSLNEWRQVLLHYIHQPRENQAFLYVTEGFLMEDKDGRWTLFSGGHLSISKEHVARIAGDGPGFIDLFIILPENMVSRRAKIYGTYPSRPIRDELGIKIGDQRVILVKIRIPYKWTMGLFSGKQDTKRDGFETIWDIKR